VQLQTNDPRYRLLDAWRGVACLIVVIYHAGFALGRDEAVSASAGWVRWGTVASLRMMSLGVPIFFVISGYCIATSADANRRRGLSSWSFLKRRFWRIYPPYWVSFFGVVALVTGLDAVGLARWHGEPIGLQSPGELGWSQWVGNLTLTETWRPLAWGVADHEPFTRVAWTLCYEEQFYFVCFLMLWLAPRRLYEALAVFSAVVIAFRIGIWGVGWVDRIDGTFPTLWHEFAAGLAVYWRLNVARCEGAKRAVEAGLAALFVIGLLWGLRSTAGAGGFGLILIALRRWDGQADDWAPLRALAACGGRCYSIYLAHLPVCTVGIASLGELGLTGFWTRVVVVVPLLWVVATAAGWLFFELVESRFHNTVLTRSPGGPKRRSPRPPQGRLVLESRS
jgi:peptidoglycan/LPS O-acetylase OafA/YrhL